jgi:hypothetical protein
MRISSLGGFAVGSVVLRGKHVSVMPAAASLMDAVYALFPRPQPPMVQDPDRGSLAPKVPDLRDAGFIAALTEWNQKTDRIEAAIAIMLEVEKDGIGAIDRTRLKLWCEAAEAELGAALTREEIAAILAEARRVSVGAVEGARKN